MEEANLSRRRVPWHIRLAARVFIKWFLKGKLRETYQCDGRVNWLFPNALNDHMRGNFPRDECTADVQVPYFELAHWMANAAGYDFSCYTLLKDWGGDEQMAAMDAMGLPTEKGCLAITKPRPVRAGIRGWWGCMWGTDQ